MDRSADPWLPKQSVANWRLGIHERRSDHLWWTSLPASNSIATWNRHFATAGHGAAKTLGPIAEGLPGYDPGQPYFHT